MAKTRPKIVFSASQRASDIGRDNESSGSTSPKLRKTKKRWGLSGYFDVTSLRAGFEAWWEVHVEEKLKGKNRIDPETQKTKSLRDKRAS